MPSFVSDFKNISDVILLLIPVIIVIILIFKFVLPKRPVLGIGLAGGVGLLGYFLIKRRLKNAFDVEDKIAEHNEMIAEFKERQSIRYNEVMANKKVIENLEAQKEKLEKQGETYKTEIELIDAELNDRKKLNKQLIERSEHFLQETAGRSQSYEALLKRFREQSGNATPVEVSTTESGMSVIEIDGYRLTEEQT